MLNRTVPPWLIKAFERAFDLEWSECYHPFWGLTIIPRVDNDTQQRVLNVISLFMSKTLQEAAKKANVELFIANKKVSYEPKINFSDIEKDYGFVRDEDVIFLVSLFREVDT